ncbi:MAG: HAD family hydrolase [Candidatus Tectimicrobiota bacterium]
MPITLALFDMAATTVDDTIAGRPLVLQSFADSFAAAGVSVPWELLNAQRGKDKFEVFHTLLASHGGLQGAQLQHITRTLLAHFTAQLLANVPYLREMPGATAAFRFLKQQGVFIALGSGFPLEVTRAITRHLGWSAHGLVDYVTCGEAAGAGRPQPHMLHCALQAAGLLAREHPVEHLASHFDYSQVLKVGDTVQDVAEGLHVGAVTIAVASGTQTAATLQQAGPLAVLDSVAQLPAYLMTHGYVRPGQAETPPLGEAS